MKLSELFKSLKKSQLIVWIIARKRGSLSLDRMLARSPSMILKLARLQEHASIDLLRSLPPFAKQKIK